MMTLDRNI